MIIQNINQTKIIQLDVRKFSFFITLIMILPIIGISQIELKSVPYRKGNKWGIKELKTGKELLEVKYDSIGRFTELVTWVKKGRCYGFVHRNGLRITPMIHRKITKRKLDRAKRKHRKKYYKQYGWEKKEKKPGIGRCSVINITVYFERIEEDGLTGIMIRKSNDVKYEGDFEVLDSYSENMKNFEKKWIIIKPIFESFTETLTGLAIVKVQDKWYLINKYGNRINKKIYDYLEVDPSDTKAIGRRIKFCKDGKWGFLVLDGSECIEAKYTKIDFYNEGIAIVFDDQNRMGYIDMDGIEYFEK